MKASRALVVRLAALGLVALLLLFWLIAASMRYHGGDVITYLAAGERLNAGHQLYALMPGDRQVVIDPRHYTAPLLYPPLIAVLWRPLALLPEQIATNAFLLVNAAALVVAVAYLLRSLKPAALLAVAAFSTGIAVTLVQGNVNGLLIAGCVVVWRYRDRPWVGALVALMAAVKLYPAVFAIWLAGQRRWRAVAWFAGAGAALLALSVAGAGLDAHFTYLDIARSASPSEQSLSALTGVPWACFAVDAVGCAAVFLLRRRPAWSYRTAILTMTLGLPSFGVLASGMLVALAAPDAAPTPEAERTGVSAIVRSSAAAEAMPAPSATAPADNRP